MNDAPSRGMRVLKWLAPFLSGAVLGFLIVRVSTCESNGSGAAPLPAPVDTGPPP